MVKNPPANVGDAGLIPGSGRPPGEGNGNPLHYSCWEIPWTEEPVRLQSKGSQSIGHDRMTENTCTPIGSWPKSLNVETVT